MKVIDSLLAHKSILCGLIVATISSAGIAQDAVSVQNVEPRREVAMADASGRSADGVYRYYAKGDDKPFTGILFAKYANGNYSSWQEYVDGIGQGKWINEISYSWYSSILKDNGLVE